MFVIQLIIIQAVTFIMIVFVLRKMLYSASVRETKRLQQLNQENAKKLQEMAGKIEEAENQCRERISAADAQVKKMKTDAQDEIDKIREESFKKAKQESDRITASALNTKEKLKEEIEFQLREKYKEQSLSLVFDVLNSGNQVLLHKNFFDEVLQEIEKIDPRKIQVNVDKGVFISAYEIEKIEKEKLEAILSHKTGKAVLLEQTVDKGIIAGIIVKLGSLVIDASLAGKFKAAAEKKFKDS